MAKKPQKPKPIKEGAGSAFIRLLIGVPKKK
jgi:hypothetical protein